MQWLNKVVDELNTKVPEGEILVESGVSPSGKYHVGTLREVLTAEVIMRELKRRGRDSKHIHFVDDLDALRKIPAGVPEKFEQYLGKSLFDIPSPNNDSQSYADYYLNDLIEGSKQLKLEMEIVRAHQKYQAGFFIDSIELALQNIEKVRGVLETISGHKLGEEWSPVQINEEGYLKKRKFLSIDNTSKTIKYEDKDGQIQSIGYANGEVKLDWRIDWPARWWKLNISVEPFGRDHATKGGSYDTGAELMKTVFNTPPPLPVPYAFINRSGETKKMSKSAGDTVNLSQLLEVLPPEVIWYFVVRYPPEKQLFFDEGDGVIRLIDEFAELLGKANKSADEIQLVEICTQNLSRTISNIPFSHLVASYQASLKDTDRTIEIIQRTEHSNIAIEQKEIIKKELVYIDNWLKNWAPEDIKFELSEQLDKNLLSNNEQKILQKLAEKVGSAPDDADGEWFHKAIYELKDELKLEPKVLFSALYKALINKTSGPRAGWFLSILPRGWLVKRLKLEA